jgi:hypothetical protein
VSSGQYAGAEANQLVEEFMLLANMTVAGMIAEGLPKHAMLRCVRAGEASRGGVMVGRGGWEYLWSSAVLQR